MAAASCVAVLSANNVPLYIHSADPSRALADQYSLHTSLDVIEEKTGAHFASSAADSNIKKTNTTGASAVVAPIKGEQVGSSVENQTLVSCDLPAHSRAGTSTSAPSSPRRSRRCTVT